MRTSVYREVLAISAARQAVLVCLLGKAPWFGAFVILTLHVVETLGQPYSAAGVLTAVFTLAAAIASPWRGRLLDTIGLRRTLLPSLLVLPPLFAVAPFVDYWWLLASMTVVGLLAIPWFGLTRQIMLAAVPVELRRTGLALDSAVSEVAYMLGPTLGVVLAISWDTGWALTTFALVSLAGGAYLVWRNPPLVGGVARDAADGARPRHPMTAWLTAAAVASFVGTLATTFALHGTDLAVIAAVRAMDATPRLTVVLVAWGFGSLVGGLVYGGPLGRHASLTFLVTGLALTTAAIALADSIPWLVFWMTIAGLFCAPCLAASAEMLSHAVPESVRGEAMGWQGSFATIGGAMSPPVVGWAMDGWGWQAGYLVAGAMALALALAGAVLIRVGRATRRRVSSAR